VVESGASSSETVSGKAIFAVNASETNRVSEQVSTNTRFVVNASETARAQDVVNRRSLWEPIDTDVDGNWALINTNQ